MVNRVFCYDDIMENKHLIADIPQKAIIEKNGKVLLIRPVNKDKWELPGGRLHKGETTQEGIKREIKEELGLDIEPKNIIDAFVLLEETPPNHFTVVWQSSLLNGSEEIKLQEDEIAEAKWVSKREIDEMVFYKEHKNALKRYFGI